jgi:uroporphyrinogen-III synthase
MKAHDVISAGAAVRADIMRALVTRPRAEAATLAAELARRGIEPVIEPLVEIVERGATLPGLAAIQAMLCTSANGVRALARAGAPRGLPLFAVGDATARAAREAGFGRVESAGGDVGDLARLVRRRLRPADGALLHAAGSETAGDLAGRLAGAGFAVERTVLYEARPVAALSPDTAGLVASGEIALTLFFSPRTAGIFGGLVTQAGIAAGLAATEALSISRAADAALAGLPFRRRAIAAAPTQAALLALVDQCVGQLA